METETYPLVNTLSSDVLPLAPSPLERKMNVSILVQRDLWNPPAGISRLVFSRRVDRRQNHVQKHQLTLDRFRSAAERHLNDAPLN